MEEEEEYPCEGEEFLENVADLPKTITKEEAAECLNSVGPTFRNIGTINSYNYSTYAYLCMDISGRYLTDITIIPKFPHVICLNLSRNRLTNDSLTAIAEMSQIVCLILDDNLLDTANLPSFPELQILSLRHNQIASCELSCQPNLRNLELGGNYITEIDPNLLNSEGLPEIKELGLRNNGLISMAGINLPTLVSLFLPKNEIMVLEDLEMLPNLKFLHLRSNPLQSLDGFTKANSKLFYLNIRNCKINTVKELKKLAILPKLERIVVSQNPFINVEYRVQVLAFLPNLQRIDKTLVDEKERKKAMRLKQKIMKENGDDDDDEMNEDY